MSTGTQTWPGDSEWKTLAENRDSIVDRSKGLLSGITEEQLNWRPDPKRWSAGEIVGHLAETNRRYLDVMEPAIDEGRNRSRKADGPFRYGWFERWFVGLLEPPAKRSLKAPASFVPAQKAAGADDVRGFLRSLDRYSEALEAAEGLDWKGIRVRNPVLRFLRFSLGTCFHVLDAHTRRHLDQLERVKNEPSFPGGNPA